MEFSAVATNIVDVFVSLPPASSIGMQIENEVAASYQWQMFIPAVSTGYVLCKSYEQKIVC